MEHIIERSWECLVDNSQTNPVSSKTKILLEIKNMTARINEIMDIAWKIYWFEFLVNPNQDTVGDFLKEVEKTKNSFELLKRMFELARNQILENHNHNININIELSNILNDDFNKLLLTYKQQSNNIILEVVEIKYIDNNQNEIFNRLTDAQSLWYKIAMDDISPITSADNHSMKLLEDAQDQGFRFNVWKIDGKYFQNLFNADLTISDENFRKLSVFIQELSEQHKINSFVIEWVQTEEHYNCFQELVEVLSENNIELNFQGFYTAELAKNT